MDQEQIASALRDAIQPPVRTNRTEDIGTESSSDDDDDDDDDDNDDDDGTGESSDGDDDTIDSSSDAEDDSHYRSHSFGEEDPLAGLKSCSEYQTLIDENFAPEVVLAGLIKGGAAAPSLDELTAWCFDEHAEQDIQAILAAYCQEHARRQTTQNSVPVRATKKVAATLPPPPSSPPLPRRMESQLIIPASGGAVLISQQFASVWDQFLAEVESVAGKADHLSFLVLAKGLEALAAQVEPLNRTFFSQFQGGKPNLVRIDMIVNEFWNYLFYKKISKAVNIRTGTE